MWTATSTVVQTENMTKSHSGTVVPSLICNSTIATMAKPDRSSEVVEVAFSFARDICRRLHESLCELSNVFAVKSSSSYLQQLAMLCELSDGWYGNGGTCRNCDGDERSRDITLSINSSPAKFGAISLCKLSDLGRGVILIWGILGVVATDAVL